MPRIIVTPESLFDLSNEITQSANRLRDLEGQLGQLLSGMDWNVRQQVNIEERVSSARAQASQLAQEADSLASFLNDRAGAFRRADEDSHNGWNNAFPPAPVPVPTPTIPPGVSIVTTPSLEDLIRSIGDFLKPIDWATHTPRAMRTFNKTIEEIGRMLNGLTGQRGYIKLFEQLGDFMRDASKGLGGITSLLDVKDLQRYRNRQITNAEVANLAITSIVGTIAGACGVGLLPGIGIAVLGNMLAKWMVTNMTDPSGHWQGLVTPVM